MCVIDQVPVRTDCLSTSETTADGMEEHGCIDAAHNVKHDIVSLELGDFGKKNTITTYLQMGRCAQRGSAARKGLRKTLDE